MSASKPPLEAVLLDAGGTLVRLDFEWMSETLRALGIAADPAALRRAEVEGRRRYDRTADHRLAHANSSSPIGATGDTQAYFAGMLTAAGVTPDLEPAILERFRARHETRGLWDRPAEGARAALDRLTALRLRPAAVSNSDGRAEQHLIANGVREGLEFVMDSHLEGVEKPDPRLFARALERLGVPAARALYVGDIVSVDVRGAHAAAMHAVLLDPFGDYAPAGVDAIPEIAALPEWIERRFAIVPASRIAAPSRRPGERA